MGGRTPGLDVMEYHRARGVSCDMNKPYVWNKRFELVRQSKDSPFCLNTMDFRSIGMGAHFVDGEYDTVFGGFEHSGQRYVVDNDGIRGAVRRMTCERKPEIPGLHWTLYHNQMSNVNERFPGVTEWLAHFKSNLIGVIPTNVPVSALRNAWLYSVNPKRRLRIMSVLERHRDGWDEGKWIRGGEIEYKAKPGERLPPGKYLRAIGDLTTIGSAVLGYYMDYVKLAFKADFVYNGCRAKFVKSPDKEELRDVFRRLIEPEHRMEFVFHSDDSSFAFKLESGEIIRFNMDISACDGSNFEPVFALLEKAMKVDTRFDVDIERCFSQLGCPFRVRMRHDRKSSALFKPILGRVLYSGSVLTTSVNNMANTLLFLAIAGLGSMDRETALRRIPEAAAQVGYIVTLEECMYVEDLQFLKHSPCEIHEGGYEPIVNLGTMMRNWGRCRGDLPGKKKAGIKARARIFLSDVAKSFVHHGRNVIVKAFEAHRVAQSNPNNLQQVKEYTTGASKGTCVTESLGRRYRCTSCEMEELADAIVHVSFGTRYYSETVRRIMSKDYGFP